MKKVIFASLFAILALTAATFSTFAATPAAKQSTGPYEGTFTGQLQGSNHSRATLTLELTDRDHEVTGTATIGRGLVVNAGNVCGQASIPAGSIWAEGLTTSRHPDELSASAPVQVSGLNITVDVAGELSADGETMDVTATIDVPWICGKDPAITGTLYKTS